MKLYGWRPETIEQNNVLTADRKFGSFLMTPGIKFGSVSGDIVDLRKYCSAVENQDKLSSCVGNAVVGALELLESVEGLPYVELSRLFPYYNARSDMNEVDKDEGCNISIAMGTLNRHGVCREILWPYDVTNVFMQPSVKAYIDGFKHRASNSFKIMSYGQELYESIVTALRANHPVVFGAQIYSSLLKSTGPVALPAGTSIGRHAMLIVGVDTTVNAFIVRNSWGQFWGDQGYCYIPIDYVLNSAEASDFWIVALYK